MLWYYSHISLLIAPYNLPLIQTEFRNAKYKPSAGIFILERERTDLAAVSAFSLPQILT